MVNEVITPVPCTHPKKARFWDVLEGVMIHTQITISVTDKITTDLH